MEGMFWLKPEVPDLPKTRCPCKAELRGHTEHPKPSPCSHQLDPQSHSCVCPAAPPDKARNGNIPPKYCTEAHKHHLPQPPQTVAEAEVSDLLQSSQEKAALAPTQHLPSGTQ